MLRMVALNNKLYKMHGTYIQLQLFWREAVRPDLSGIVHTMYNYCGASYWPRGVKFLFPMQISEIQSIYKWWECPTCLFKAYDMSEIYM
jgi:hypothetical protein